MDAIQAARLLRALDVIDEVIDERIMLRQQYIVSLGDAAKEHGAAMRAPLYPGIRTNAYMTTLSRTNQRSSAAVIVKGLAANGIEARRIYPMTIADQAKGAIEFGPLTYSRALTPFIVSLPLYYGMTPETVERCVKAYVEAVK